VRQACVEAVLTQTESSLREECKKRDGDTEKLFRSFQEAFRREQFPQKGSDHELLTPLRWLWDDYCRGFESLHREGTTEFGAEWVPKRVPRLAWLCAAWQQLPAELREIYPCLTTCSEGEGFLFNWALLGALADEAVTPPEGSGARFYDRLIEEHF